MIPFRPHHVLCSIGFQGKGHSDPFLANMRALVQGLRAPDGRQERLRFASRADTICAPCPKRVGLGCWRQSLVDALDSRHAAALGIEEDDVLTWGEAYDRAVTRVRPADLNQLCAGCKFLDDGMCKSALAQARGETWDGPVRPRGVDLDKRAPPGAA